ncbi:MAG TPA: hypothetical protein VMI35_04485, partial [Puia sp.]|nr:hypothetical protein [Puia sp.]
TRLWNVLYLNKPTLPAISYVPVFSGWRKKTWLITKAVVLILAMYSTIYGILKSEKQYGDKREKPPYYGIYDVQTWVRNKDSIPPLDTDTSRWKKLILDFPGHAAVILMNDSVRRFIFKLDSSFATATMYPYEDSVHKYFWTIHGDSTHLYLRGVFMKDSLKIAFNKYDLNKFRLLNREFHWINEYPFNR